MVDTQKVHSMQLRKRAGKCKVDEGNSKVRAGEKINAKRNVIRESRSKPTPQRKKGQKAADEEVTVPFLPMEIIRRIFLFLPADFLYSVLRLVCRQWRNLIIDPGFIKDHLNVSATGTLILTQVPADTWKYVGHFVEMVNDDKPSGSRHHLQRKRKRNVKPLVQEGKIIFTEQELENRLIIHSCDGLVLLKDRVNLNRIKSFHVVNPIRKEGVTITPPLNPLRGTIFNYAAIARARRGTEYKIVIRYFSNMERHSSIYFYALVSTIGNANNGWKMLMSLEPRNFPEFKMYAAGCYVYWVSYRYDNMYSLVVDVENERIHKVANGPKEFDLYPRYKGGAKCYIESETFLIVAAKCEDFSWSLWGLTDVENGGEWTHLYDVNLSTKLPLVGVKKEQNKFATPKLVVLESDMIVFSIDHCPSFIGYKVKTGHIFKLGRHPAGTVVSGYVPSLVPVLN